VEETRAATSDWYGRLILRIRGYVTEGGPETKAKIFTAVKEAEEELEAVLGKSKSNVNVSVVEVEKVLAPVRATIDVQLKEIKQSVDHYETGATKVEVDKKLLAICDAGQDQVNGTFANVTEMVTVATSGAVGKLRI
jgi:hypothetical protein